MLKKYLLAPGPTPVPHEALLAMAAPVIHHRTPQFSEIFRAVVESSRELFGTEQPVMLLSTSGTGGLEAAVTNTLSPGDRVIVVEGGKFGERWTEICESFGLRVETLQVQWGTAIEPARVAAALEEFSDSKAVLVQYSETSTGVLHPVPQLAKLTEERDCLLIVDGITSVGVIESAMDATGIDVLVTGSQKALMLPPGLALVALSEKAWAFNAKAELPRYYLDLAKERAAVLKDTSAYTPSIALISGLKAVYQVVEAAGGWPEAYRRHAILASAMRAGVIAMELELLAPQNPSPATTAVRVPDGIDGGDLTRRLRDVMGVTVGGGQGRLKGKIFRLAHIGYADTFDVTTALSATEMALASLGHRGVLGRGPGAAAEVLQQMYA